MHPSVHLTKIAGLLEELYGKEQAQEYYPKLCDILDKYRGNEVIQAKRKKYNDTPPISEACSVLITYPDSIVEPEIKPLKTLLKFLRTYVKDTVSCVHILPFFPSSSDGGFSVINFREVDERLGDWDDIEAIDKEYTVMSDLILNHVSVQSEWFQKFLQGDKQYQQYFNVYDEEVDTSSVHRPREHPLLTKFETKTGDKYVWTTFSPDQADLNFRHPPVLLEMIDILLLYLSHSIEWIRLDATAYLWDDPSTSSVNLPQTHTIVKILRYVLEEIAPYAAFLSETPFPLAANLSYFGNGEDEVHMVYAFHLPPLVVDAFVQKDTTFIGQFFDDHKFKKDDLFFNILATHDGISVQGVEDFLPHDSMHEMADALLERDAFISYKLLDEKKIPYEMNITYFDAINDLGDESKEAVDRFLASQAIMLALKGVPGIYIHSLLASRNNLEEAKKTGIKRLINRAKFTWEEVEKSLQELNSRRRFCLEGFRTLLTKRCAISQFSPYASQKILPMDKRLFVVERVSEDGKMTVVVNVSDQVIPIPQFKWKEDLLSESLFKGEAEPRGVYFLKG